MHLATQPTPCTTGQVHLLVINNCDLILQNPAFMHNNISLSTVVLNSRDRWEIVWLPENFVL